METRSSPSMRELRAVAADRGLKYYLHLSKPELFALLQKEGGGGAPSKHDKQDTKQDAKQSAVRESEAAEAAEAPRAKQRPSRRKGKRKTPADARADATRQRKKAKVIVNTLDPIMLSELGPHTFEFVRSNGSVVVYNVDSLVQYILATGDFSEPETRIPFSDDDLVRIDLEANKANLNEKSVVDAKKNKHKFEEQKVKRDGILGLERCASEYVNKMLEIVESDDPEEGEMLLIMSVFPSFSDIFEQIRRSDTEYAKHAMGHFIEYMKGPKNRRTVDNSGLLPVILGFLDDVAKGKQGASAFGF